MTDDSKKKKATPPQGEMHTITLGSKKFPCSLVGYINVVEKICKLGEIPWFRGHAVDTDWLLAPSIFRDLISEGVTDKRMKKLRTGEAETNIDFRHHAKARDRNFPHDDDQVGQLVVARHHGLRSRLLDWTESPLTALFFAVEGDGNKEEENPACVWVLAPGALNVKQWGVRVYYSHAFVPKAIAHCAFNSTVTLEKALEVMEQKSEVKTEKIGIVASFKPQHTIPRHMAQKAQFTIHHTPKALDKLPGASEFVSKIIIPFNKREKILDELRRAGISRELLFPDLDNLSEHLNAEIERRMWK